MTNYNTADVIRQSLDSIFSVLLGLEFEVVAVDNYSGDGSYEVLLEYARTHSNMRVLRKRCLRGMGWQTAFEASRGDLVVLAACDTVYSPTWRALIGCFLSKELDFGLSAVFTEICPRRLLLAVGGWRNLQYWEDVDLRARLAAKDAWRDYPVVCGVNLKRTVATSRAEKAYRLYRRIHDKMLVASWIPPGLFVRGYAAAILSQRGGKKLVRFAYYMPIVLSALVVSATRKSRFRVRGTDPTTLADPRWLIDLGLVPPDKLQIPDRRYETREACEEALRRSDFAFLPGFYD